MGGGGAFRAAAKVAGVTVTNSGFHFVTAEHPVYTIARNVIRPVSVSAISLSSEDVKSSIVTAVNDGGGRGLSDVLSMQKVVAEFDDWEMAGGEEYRFLDVDICRGDISELSPILICNMMNPLLTLIPFLNHPEGVRLPNLSLSDFFNNLLGSNKVFFNADGSAKLGIVEMTLGASFRLGSHGYDGDCLKTRSIMMSS
ncbi:hypothetical protein BC332_02682 [Capsicum chinense]|nr:hypothetical protein BC332_02682 [Capsicum chinense]